LLNVDRLGGIAYRQASRICSRRQDIVDAKQDIVLAVLRTWRDYRPDRGSPDAFVGTVATNAATSLLRHRRAVKRNGGRPPLPLCAAHGQIDQRSTESLEAVRLRLDLAEHISLLPLKLRARCEQYLAFHRGERSTSVSLEGRIAELRRYLEPLRPPRSTSLTTPPLGPIGRAKPRKESR
jgi:DNA-directed RNA polymerase specialized sigma24 family protein